MRPNTYGEYCEKMAYNYLKNNGYKIIALNYRNKIGEIDIIALDGDTTVFFEVKGRFSRKFGDPFEAIDYRKQQKIRNVATVFMMKNKMLNSPVRFDAISVLGEGETEIRHVKNAF